MEAQGEARVITLPPGDALVYRGGLLPHWRERFEGRCWVQLFLHYVRRDGVFADCRFDGRERLGPVEPGQDPRRRDLHRRFATNDPCPCGSGLRYGACHGRQAGG
ncbi:MAG: SEC-C metal-binding domain-containing protein [Gammaproteobacteria bacterium]